MNKFKDDYIKKIVHIISEESGLVVDSIDIKKDRRISCHGDIEEPFDMYEAVVLHKVVTKYQHTFLSQLLALVTIYFDKESNKIVCIKCLKRTYKDKELKQLLFTLKLSGDKYGNV